MARSRIAQAGSARRAVTLHRRIVQVGVAGPLPLYLQLSRPHDASGDLRAGFAAATWLAQALELYSRNVHMQVQTIEQRTRNPRAIPLHLIASAVTSIRSRRRDNHTDKGSSPRSTGSAPEIPPGAPHAKS